jgi:acetylglutamate kinase
VRAADGQICPMLTPALCASLIFSEVATGGMRAKLEAASDALRRGVSSVVIAPGSLPDVVHQLVSGTAIGTALVGENLQAVR